MAQITKGRTTDCSNSEGGRRVCRSSIINHGQQLSHSAGLYRGVGDVVHVVVVGRAKKVPCACQQKKEQTEKAQKRTKKSKKGKQQKKSKTEQKRGRSGGGGGGGGGGG